MRKLDGSRQMGRPRHRIVLKWVLKKKEERPWNGLVWLRIGRSGRMS